MASGVVNIRHVAQAEPYGCGVACLAMLAGWSYAEARRRYVAIYGEKRAAVLQTGAGVTYVEVDTVLAEAAGLAVARQWKPWADNPTRKPWPCLPWADAHLVQVMVPSGGHFVVLLRDGSVLDPARGPEPVRLEAYADVQFVAAVVPVGLPALAA